MNPITALADLMLQILNLFYALSGNYGWAIILLTVVTNLLLYPLTFQSVKQMGEMQKIQPKLKALQEKHKGQPEKLQKEMMGLYKQEKINPLGGCLPLLLKIPFFIALFFALQSQEFKQIVANPAIRASFLWIKDLAAPDPSYLLVALIGVTTYYSQKTMPGQGMSEQMGGGLMLWFMPVFIALISAPFPAGVQIYWVATNLVAIAQQVYIARILR